ncbi:hypothetical protein RhiirA5_418990 [Rhizophagus irregularis]|uniref:Uncharacterized protein n=1 Tax=Rhizophagus irregularis TaxID=588596 RepID=A0A2N0PJ55_9GLOM|nr:hypothetical protein RhiirA5_418990 [Rhizophagus irregularis]
MEFVPYDKFEDVEFITEGELIIKICDGVRPTIVVNAPEGYVELMKECCKKRPTADNLSKIFSVGGRLYYWKERFSNSTKIVKSQDIGPIVNNPSAVYH